MSSHPPPEAGLGHSTPLVTIPQLHGSGIRTAQQQQLVGSLSVTDTALLSAPSSSTSSSIATTDHPLAVPTLSLSNSSSAVAVVPGMDLELSERNTGQQQQQQRATVTPIHTVSVPSPAPFAKTRPQISPTPVSTNKSLDTLTDNFLAGPSARIEQGQKPILRPDPLPETATDLERLRLLVARRAWADALQVATLLLQNSSTSPYVSLYTALLNYQPDQAATDSLGLDSHQAELVEILTLQCHARLELKQYMDLGIAVDSWSFCPYTMGGTTAAAASPTAATSPTTAPTWVPWSLHILAAASLEYTRAPVRTTTNNTESDQPDATSAVDALSALRADLPTDLYAERLQVEHALANVWIRQEQWRPALASLQRMLDLVPAAVSAVSNNSNSNNTTNAPAATVVVLEAAYRCEILSRQGRILLQVGAVDEAGQVLEEAKTTWSDLGDNNSIDPLLTGSNVVQLIPAQLGANEGLYSFACGNYDAASEFFRKAIESIRAAGPMTCSYQVSDWVGPTMPLVGTEFRQTLYSETINNTALCAIYTCRLQEAVHSMECLVRENPTAFLTERVAYNLCTLYELGSDTATSSRKKRVLQTVATRFFLHDVGAESFRIS